MTTTVRDLGYDSYTWMQTSSNSEVDFTAEHWIALPIEDIANALANTCRYNGHCSRFFSVAEHSVLMSRLVRPELALAALLHDASEAYVGDIPRPLKRVMGTAFKDMERKAMRAVAQRYGVTMHDLEHPEIKALDKKILADEAAALMPRHAFWDQFTERTGVEIAGWNPAEAREKFLQRYAELKS